MLSTQCTSGALMYVHFCSCKCRIMQLIFCRTSRTSLTLCLISTSDSAVASFHIPAPCWEICLKLIKFTDNKGKKEFKHSLFYELLQWENQSFHCPWFFLEFKQAWMQQPLSPLLPAVLCFILSSCASFVMECMDVVHLVRLEWRTWRN